MRIIIDFNPLLYDCIAPQASRFMMDCLTHIAKENPENEWFFLTDRSYPEKSWENFNKKILVEKKILPGRLGWKIWYDRQIPGLIKKHRAGLFISTGGVASSYAVPQCIWIPGRTRGMNWIKKGSYLFFYEKRLKNTLQRARTIFLFSEDNKKEILQQDELAAAKMQVVHSAPGDECRPLLWTEKENVRVRYAGGKEYFAVAGSADQQNLVNVLKAFSQFKKWQQSNMQLVIAIEGISGDIDFADKLSNYKYRNDVYLCDHLPEEDMLKIVSAAYALVYPAEEGDPGSVILNAFKTNVPVITTREGCPQEITGDAVLYADITVPGSLAGVLMQVYKDETLRNGCIDKGNMRALQFNWKQTAVQVWNGILQAVDN